MSEISDAERTALRARALANIRIGELGRIMLAMLDAEAKGDRVAMIIAEARLAALEAEAD